MIAEIEPADREASVVTGFADVIASLPPRVVLSWRDRTIIAVTTFFVAAVLVFVTIVTVALLVQ